MAGEVAAKIVADTSGFQAGMAQAATAAEREQRKIAALVKAVTAELKVQASASKEAANTAPYERVAASAKKAAESHAGAQREVLVLAHELSQGNYSRFGGSLLVLGEQINLMGKLMTPVGAAIGGLVAVVGGAAVAMAMGAIQGEKFAKQLQLTGNFAAVTAGQVEAMVQAQKGLTGQSIGGARESIETVAGTGRFGPQALAQVSRAMGDYEKLSHSSAEEASKIFEGVADDAAAWDEKMNKSYHFLTLAQYDQIKALQDSGDSQGAAALASDALAQALESRGTPAAGIFARTWHSVMDAVNGAVDAMKNVGRPEDALTAGIAAIDRQVALVKQANTANPADAAPYLQNLGAERARLVQEQFRAGEQAAAASVAAQEQQAAIEARKYTDQVLRSAKAVSARNDELKKFHEAAAAQAAAGRPLSATDLKAGEDSINRRYTDHSGDSQASAYTQLMESIKAFNATTDEEISRQGKLTEAQSFAIRSHEELEKAKKKLTAAQYAEIGAAIDEAAAQRQVAQFSLDAAKATIARVQADTANQQAQQGLLEGVLQSGNDQANAIVRQMETIGKTSDQITKLNALRQFDDMIGKALLGADQDTVKRIQEVATVLRGNLVTAIDAAKQSQDDFNASFVNGWHQAASEFRKSATDNAAAGRKVFEDAANGWSDAWAKAATSGKLSFRSMIDSIIADLVRLQAQKAFSSVVGSGSSTFSLFDTAQGSSGASGTGSFSDLFSGSFGGGYFANGLDYVPYDGFPAVLHEGEKVVRRQDAAAQRGGGPSIHIDQSGMSFAAGVDAAGVAHAVRTGMAQTKAEIYRSLSTGGAR